MMQTSESAVDSMQTYLDSIQCPLLSREQTVALSERIRAGDTGAMQTLVLSNLRLVIAVVMQNQRKMRSFDRDQMMALISAGNMGLMVAVKRYDPSVGAFSTYAVPWIREAINVQCTFDRYPVQVSARSIRRYHAWLTATVDEEKAWRQLTPAQGQAFRSLWYLEHGVRDVQIDLHDPALDFENRSIERVDLQQLMASLTAEERSCVGLFIIQSCTYKETAKILNVTPSHVESVIKRAIGKMKMLAHIPASVFPESVGVACERRPLPFPSRCAQLALFPDGTA